MLTERFFPALAHAVSQWRIAWLFASANLTEARRINKIALITPFLSVVFQAGFLGLIYSALFGFDIKHYLPFLAVGLALWHSIAVFVTNAVGYNDIANRHLSFTGLSLYTIHLSGLIESILLLFVKILAAGLVVVLVQQNIPVWTSIFMALFGIFVLAPCLFFLGVLAAYLFDRFRLLRAFLPQLLFLGFLITPVIWQKEQLQGMGWVADYNPLAHMLAIVRAPLLGEAMPWISLSMVGAMTGLMAALGAVVHRTNRALILFRWVA